MIDQTRADAPRTTGHPDPTAPYVLVMRGFGRLAPRARHRPACGRFTNGECHVAVPDEVAGQRCVVVGTVSPPAENLVWVTQTAHALRRAGADTITAVLPYLAYARQDRADLGQSLGLEWLGQLLRASGVTEIVCVDVHSPDAPTLLGLPLVSLSPATVLAAALPDDWRTDVCFVAPDEGALCRCTALAVAAGAQTEVVWARKRRTPAGVSIRALVGSPTPRAVIVDDILDTGGTLLACCAALREQAVREIGVVVTHGLFTGNPWPALKRAGVGRIWMTDSILPRSRPAVAEVVPLAGILAPLLTGGPTGSEE